MGIERSKATQLSTIRGALTGGYSDNPSIVRKELKLLIGITAFKPKRFYCHCEYIGGDNLPACIDIMQSLGCGVPMKEYVDAKPAISTRKVFSISL